MWIQVPRLMMSSCMGSHTMKDCLNYAQVELKGCMCAKKTPPTLLHQQQDKMLIQCRMDPDLYVVYAKISPRGFHSRTPKLRRGGNVSFTLSSLMFNFGSAAPVRGLLLQACACERGFICLFAARTASCPVWPSSQLTFFFFWTWLYPWFYSSWRDISISNQFKYSQSVWYLIKNLINNWYVISAIIVQIPFCSDCQTLDFQLFH